jgi:hypothetical protein
MIAGGVALVAGTGVLLLRNPAVLFAWSVSVEGLTLYADAPFAPAEGEKVLHEVREKLLASPWYELGRQDAAFICNTRWRRLIFFIGNPRASALNYAPGTTAVFLCGGNVAANRLITRAGRAAPGEMTLAYFIAHEIAHTLTVEHVGAMRYYRRVPSWLKEAYADRIARGSVWERSEARRAFLQNAPEMNWPVAAPYLRYNLLLGFLLEEEHRSLDEVFASGAEQAEVEARLTRFLREERRVEETKR